MNKGTPADPLREVPGSLREAFGDYWENLPHYRRSYSDAWEDFSAGWYATLATKQPPPSSPEPLTDSQWRAARAVVIEADKGRVFEPGNLNGFGANLTLVPAELIDNLRRALSAPPSSPEPLTDGQINAAEKAYASVAAPAWTSNRHRPALAAALRVALAAKPTEPAVYINPNSYKDLTSYRGGGPMGYFPADWVSAEKTEYYSLALVPLK